MDTKLLLQEVKTNQAKLKSCSGHRFPAIGSNYRIGMKLTCTRCGGTMSLTDAVHYMEGYVAHGGNAQDILPDWPQGQGARRHG